MNNQIRKILEELMRGDMPFSSAEQYLTEEINRIVNKSVVNPLPINQTDWKNDFSILAKKLELPPDNKKVEEVERFVLSIINTAITREKQLTAKLIEEKGNQIKNKLCQELDRILPWLYDYLEEVEVKLKKDGNLEYTTGFNEGRFATVKQFKNTLINIWNEMKARFKKNKPQDQGKQIYEEGEARPWHQVVEWPQMEVDVTDGTITPLNSEPQRNRTATEELSF